jgi:hypothetical protein
MQPKIFINLKLEATLKEGNIEKYYLPQAKLFTDSQLSLTKRTAQPNFLPSLTF